VDVSWTVTTDARALSARGEFGHKPRDRRVAWINYLSEMRQLEAGCEEAVEFGAGERPGHQAFGILRSAAAGNYEESSTRRPIELAHLARIGPVRTWTV
jgi:hypothetical protein